MKILRTLHLKFEQSYESFEPRIWNFLRKLSLPSMQLVSYKKSVPIQIKVQVQYFQYQNMKPICYLTLVLPALLARGYVESHGNDGHKGIDKSRNVRQSELTPLKEMFSKKDMDKNIGIKIRETRAVDFSVSVDLDVKKEKTGSKLKKNRLKMKKHALHPTDLLC